MNLKDIIYFSDKNKIFFSKNYAFTKKYVNALNKPILTIKKSQVFINNITYRKINDWDSKNMISGSRDNAKAGWRKFSLVDIIRFYIISDLRKIGLDIEKIKNILGIFSNTTFDLVKNGKPYNETFLQLEYFILSCFSGEKILLLIDEESNISFFNEKDAVEAYFHFDEASSPLIILPFFSYVRRMFKKAREERLDSTIEELYKNRITEKERKVLDIINKKNYESITIKKQNGEMKTTIGKEIQRGDFSDKEIIDAIKQKDYQNVSVSVKNGKKINITREETIKL